MRRISLVIVLAACLWPATGCQWPGLRDPALDKLTASQRLSSEGNDLLEQKKPDKAEVKLAEAVRICPTDCDAWRCYAEMLWSRNAWPQAVAQLEEACRRNPDSDLRVRLAEMYLEMGRWDEQAGRLNEQMGRFDEARHSLDEAGGNLDKAQRNIDQFLNRNFKLAAAWWVRGRVLRSKGDLLAAQGNRAQAKGDLLLASQYRDLARGAYFEALTDLQRAAAYGPKDQPDRQVIGETAAVYRSLGWWQRALESMQGLLDTYTRGEEPQQVLYLTGQDYIALGRYDDAVASLTLALPRGRPTPELLYSLGEALYGSGRTQEADAALQQALAINPQHAPSRKLHAEIQVALQTGPVRR